MNTPATIAEALSLFPETFKLEGYPLAACRASSEYSYVADSGTIMIYTEYMNAHGQWVVFLQGTVPEMLAKIAK